jgi:hypothetical protein
LDGLSKAELRELEIEHPELVPGTPESLASTPSEAGKGPPGHPAESPRAWGVVVTVAALVLIALIVWAVLV